ncbi:hypothetical protein ABIC09_005622 [Bradyrhizobium sp. S3.12.5]|uniref:hypothetical protein n=1 Tax=Bradyrhizobium sp. S3.12.5 TaxID=3156386 RepID=UPI003399A193
MELLQVIGGATHRDPIGTIHRIALACACMVSFVLWLALDSDFANALFWAAKLEGHPISGTVPVSKVAICLGWSLLAFGLICHRYWIGTIAILALLAATLVGEIGSSIVDIRFFDLPVAKSIVQSAPHGLLYALKLPFIAIALAYFIVTRRAFANAYERLCLAAILGLCAIMTWTGLFDLIYPGIAWR